MIFRLHQHVSLETKGLMFSASPENSAQFQNSQITAVVSLVTKTIYNTNHKQTSLTLPRQLSQTSKLTNYPTHRS